MPSYKELQAEVVRLNKTLEQVYSAREELKTLQSQLKDTTECFIALQSLLSPRSQGLSLRGIMEHVLQTLAGMDCFKQQTQSCILWFEAAAHVQVLAHVNLDERLINAYQSMLCYHQQGAKTAQAIQSLSIKNNSLNIPIVSNAQCIGLLQIFFPAKNCKPQACHPLLDAIASLISKTMNIKQLEKKVAMLSAHDALTGLPNRQSMLKAIQRSIARCERSLNKFALLFIDIEGIKQVNLEWGQLAGDSILKQIGVAIKASLRQVDVVSRFADSEFLVLVEGFEDEQDLQPVTQRLIFELDKALKLEGKSGEIGFSIGKSIYPDDASQLDGLLYQADLTVVHGLKGQQRD